MNDKLCAEGARLPLVCKDPASMTPAQRAERCKSLRRAHETLGLDPKYLQLPQGQRIWFVHVQLDREVHAGCLGFTRDLYEFASGATPEEACQAVRAYVTAAAPGTTVIRTHPSLSSVEQPVELFYPEQLRRLDIPYLPPRRPLS